MPVIFPIWLPSGLNRNYTKVTAGMNGAVYFLHSVTILQSTLRLKVFDVCASPYRIQ